MHMLQRITPNSASHFKDEERRLIPLKWHDVSADHELLKVLGTIPNRRAPRFEFILSSKPP